MKLMYVDFETFYSPQYSLRIMDPPSYILDPQFELIMCGVAFDDGPVQIVERDDIERFFNSLDRDNITTVSHNAQFDASILSWKFGWRPKMIIDTLAMSRTIIANRSKRHDLGSIGEHLGLGQKGHAIVDVRGMGYDAIKAAGLWDNFVDYCRTDVELCRNIFKQLAPKLPDEEFLIHDQILRMAVDPVLHADVTLLAEHLAEVQQRKAEVLARAMLVGIEGKSDLMSNQKFADVLMGLGVEPPKKISPITGMSTFAFAKSDEEFQELREHDNPVVRDLVEARLGYKSTIEETRAARLLNIGQLEFPHHGEHMMPVALRIGAARTHRLGGDWKCNFQNLGRKSKLRKALMAPPGQVLVAADAAQIEARMLAWYCGQSDVVEQFRKGEDVYASFASRLFGYQITKDNDPQKRFLGKTAVLGCGYGCGPDKFAMMVKSLSALDGAPLVLSDAQSTEIVEGYRRYNNMISSKWQWMRNNAIPVMAGKGKTLIDDGPVKFMHETVIGPNGLTMQYPQLRWVDGNFIYNDGGIPTKFYFGKLIENVIQHMARVFIMQAAHRMIPLASNLGARLVLQVHDELVYAVPEEHAQLLKGYLHQEMTREPQWAPGLPLATDVHIGHTYGDVK